MKRIVGIIAVCTGVCAAHARVVTTVLPVTATVSPSAVVGFEFSAEPLVITQADIARGYVDVVMKSRMQLKTLKGRAEVHPQIVIDISPRPDLFRSVDVASPHAANGGGKDSVTPPTVRREEVNPEGEHFAEFRYRFLLADNVRPGRYNAPISLAIDL